MKRLFRPRNLLLIAIVTTVVVVVVKKKQQDQQLASMSDDQVRDMVHDRVSGKVDPATERDIVDSASTTSATSSAGAETLASTSTGAE